MDALLPAVLNAQCRLTIGVSVAFVDRLKSHGYANWSVRDLIRLRDSGI